MNKDMNFSKEELAYRVGSLLYVPALNHKAVAKIINDGIRGAMSIAFCLEDSIDDSAVGIAESKVLETFNCLSDEKNVATSPPLYFIRVRSPKQMREIAYALENSIEALCGFILPKFDLENAEEYIASIKEINDTNKKRNTIYIMPVLETTSIAYAEFRDITLQKLRDFLLCESAYVLNIRVGGNDLCHIFGVRLCEGQTIYDIGMIRDVLSDIMNYFGRDFIVSAPTSNYFSGTAEAGGNQWKNGIKKEIKLDIINGFIGKTAIHPSQIPIINKYFMVSWDDYNDAQQILNWPSGELAVAKSISQQRMSEKKVHSNWARKIIFRANAFGIRE